MSKNTKPWSKVERSRAMRILSRHTDLRSALAEISAKVRPVTLRALQNQIPSPGQCLKQPTAEDLQTEHADRGKTTRLARDNRTLLDRLSKLQAEADARRALADVAVPAVPVRELRKHSREGAPILMASDWHVEEVVPEGATPYGNTYSLAIAERRIERFFAGSKWLIDFHRPVFGCQDVTLWLGGDFITGSIHDDPIRELGPGAAINWVEQRILDGVRFLLKDRALKSMSIVCSYGNHGRTTMKPRRASGAHNSWEWLMYQHLGARLDDSRVKFSAPPSAHQYSRVYDFDMHWHHGDEVQYYGGSGGISIPLLKATAQWDKWKPCHYRHFGHFHTRLDLGQCAVNGSLIGAAPYGMSIKATPEPPAQNFYILDSRRGKTCCSPIWVGE